MQDSIVSRDSCFSRPMLKSIPAAMLAEYLKPGSLQSQPLSEGCNPHSCKEMYRQHFYPERGFEYAMMGPWAGLGLRADLGGPQASVLILP